MDYRFLEAADGIKGNIILTGFPFDSTTSFRSGSRSGPPALRHASYGLETFSPYQHNDLSSVSYSDNGDIELPFGNTEAAIDMIYKYASAMLKDGKKLMSFGGEHTVTYPLIKAYREHYKDFTLIVFDAHADLRRDYLGFKYSHACTTRLCTDVIGNENTVVIGARSYTEEEYEYSSNILHFSTDISSIPMDKIKKNVYISVDMDVLDPSVFPGTGTPEPGGFGFDRLLRDILYFRNLNIIGCDIVELSPDYDHSGISSVTAAKIARELLLSM